MAERIVSLYIDYTSPYAYLACEPAWALEREFDARLEWLPYTLDIPLFLGTVEGRNAHQWRRIRYSYMDARRLANRRGLTVRGPQKLFDSSIAAIGMLYAQRHDVFRNYNDMVFERFWKRELDIEDVDVIAAVLTEAGAEGAGFARQAQALRDEVAAISRAAEAKGVFGVPSYIVDGELFWGREHLPDIRAMLAA